MSNRFYMMCLRETVGNNDSFHCHNGNGYSSDIDRAHVYTLEEAQKAWNCGRDIEPPISANLDVAGGRLVSVLFGDYRDDFFQPEEVDVVREALNELSVDNDDAHAEIIKKMELLTH